MKLDYITNVTETMVEELDLPAGTYILDTEANILYVTIEISEFLGLVVEGDIELNMN